jgi:anti-sigma factor RsiW
MRPRGSKAHLSTELVLEYLDGTLDAAGRARVEEHLGRPCAACRENVRVLGELVERMRRDRVPEVPAALRARALAMFQPTPGPSTLRGLVEQVARLVFDSQALPLAAATRRAVGAARRLSYALEAGQLEIEIEPESPELRTVRGRIQIEEPELHRIEIAIGEERFPLWPDASGAFSIEHLPAGAIEMTVAGPTGRYLLPAVDL